MNERLYLLDTNIISEMRRVEKGKGNQGVADWVQSLQSAQLCTSAVVMMELERGVLSMERRDPVQGQDLRIWLEQVVKQQFKEQILPLDAATAKLCAALHVPDRSPENDAWIAAQAMQHHLILVTRNEKDFADLGVRVLNPFTD